METNMGFQNITHFDANIYYSLFYNIHAVMILVHCVLKSVFSCLQETAHQMLSMASHFQ